LKYLKTKTYYFLAEPAIYYDPMSCRQFPKDFIKNDFNFITRVAHIWYRPVIILRQKIGKKHWDKNLLKSKSTVICNSHFSRESIYRVYDKVWYVCYLGVDCKQSSIEKKRKIYILSVGSLNASKGQFYVAKAISKIPSKIRPKYFVVCDNRDEKLIEGSGSLSQHLFFDIPSWFT
jgi:glycosyltransferase involved in cell wall biosynthesis